MRTDSDRAGSSLVLRAWVEPGHESPLRVRITLYDDNEGQRNLYVSSIGAVCEAISDWIGELVDQASRPP